MKPQHREAEVTGAVPVGLLEVGAHFALACKPEKHGTIKRLGDMGALVHYPPSSNGGEMISATTSVVPVVECSQCRSSLPRERAHNMSSSSNGSPAAAVRTVREINFDPKPAKDIRAARLNTKTAIMVDALSRGATLDDLLLVMSATGKQPNVRAWLGYDLKTRLGYGVRQEGSKLFQRQQ